MAAVQDPDQREAYEVHIREFGQTPRKIFNKLHPRKGLKFTPEMPIAEKQEEELKDKEKEEKQ